MFCWTRTFYCVRRICELRKEARRTKDLRRVILGYILVVDVQVLQPRLHLQTHILERIPYSPPTLRK